MKKLVLAALLIGGTTFVAPAQAGDESCRPKPQCCPTNPRCWTDTIACLLDSGQVEVVVATTVAECTE